MCLTTDMAVRNLTVRVTLVATKWVIFWVLSAISPPKAWIHCDRGTHTHHQTWSCNHGEVRHLHISVLVEIESKITFVYCCTCIGSKPVNITWGVDSGGSFLVGEWVSSSLPIWQTAALHENLNNCFASVLAVRTLLYWPGLLVGRLAVWVWHLLLLQ